MSQSFSGYVDAVANPILDPEIAIDSPLPEGRVAANVLDGTGKVFLHRFDCLIAERVEVSGYMWAALLASPRVRVHDCLAARSTV